MTSAFMSWRDNENWLAPDAHEAAIIFQAQREVYYAGKEELLMNIKKSLYAQRRPSATPKADDYMSSYSEK